MACLIANANHSIMCATAKLRVVNRFADCIWLALPQPTKGPRIGNQIDAAFIFARADVVNVRGTLRGI